MSMHTIDQAKNMRNGINLEGEVVRKGETRTVSKKTGGTIDVCDAYLKDSANEEIKITLWAEPFSLAAAIFSYVTRKYVQRLRQISHHTLQIPQSIFKFYSLSATHCLTERFGSLLGPTCHNKLVTAAYE